MGAKLFPTDVVTVARQVEEDLARLGYESVGAVSVGEQDTVRGCATRVDGLPTTCCWRAETTDRGTLLSLEIRPFGRARGTAWFLLAVLGVLVLAVVAEVLIRGGKVAESAGFLLTALLAGLWALGVFFVYTRWARTLARREAELWDGLKGQHRLKTVLPVAPSLLGRPAETGLLGLVLLMLGAAFIWLVPVVAIPVGLLLLVLLPFLAAYGLLGADPFVQWRLRVLQCLLSMAGLNFWPMLFLTLAYVAYSALSLWAVGSCESAGEALTRAARDPCSVTWITAGKAHGTSEISWVARRYVERRATELATYTCGSIEVLRSQEARRLANMRYILPGGYAVIVIGEVVILALAPWSWGMAMGKQGAIPLFRVPSVRARTGKAGRWPRVFVAAFLTGCGLLNLAGLIAAAEVIRYLITGRCGFSEVAFAFAWIDLPYSQLYGNDGDAEPLVRRLMTLAIMSAFALPPLLVPMVKMAKLARRLIGRATSRSGGERGDHARLQELQGIVGRVSARAGVARPLLRLVSASAPRLFTRRRIWQARTRLYVTTGAIQRLTDKELEAAIAHEVSHNEQGFLAIELVRLLSWALLFPNGAWHALFDFVEREFDADKRALGMIDDPEALISAIFKVGLFPPQPVQVSGAARRWPTWLGSRMNSTAQAYRSFLEFLSGEVMVGYAHPYLLERAQAIRAMKAD